MNNTKYIKDNIIKYKNQIVIYNNDLMIINPSHEMILSDGWIEYNKHEKSLEEHKLDKISEVLQYDSSLDINVFYVNNMPVWIDKPTRAVLMLRFNAEHASGKTETSLWYNGMKFKLPVTNAIQLLYALEVYASNCYDNTQRHLATIKELQTIEEIDSYDYKAGYPEKLRFQI